jgi:hypothetical protein
MTNDEGRAHGASIEFGHSGFVIVSTFVIRASSFDQALRLAFSGFIVNPWQWRKRPLVPDVSGELKRLFARSRE